MTWFADGDPPEFETARDNPKIALWPYSQNVRIDPRYRLLMGEGLPAPRAGQYFVRFVIEDGPPSVTKNCVIPLVPIGDQELEGTSGVSADGYEFILNIRPWTTPDPEFSVFGHEHTITYKHSGFPDFFVRQMYGTDDVGSQFTVRIKVDDPNWDQHMGPFWFSTDYDPLINTDVDDVAVMQDNWFHWPLSECIDLDPVPPSLFAEFNGVDAAITYSPVTFTNGARWYQDFDYRTHTLSDVVVLGKTFNTSQWSGFTGKFCRFMGFLVDMGTPVPDNVWTNIRFEYSWTVNDGIYRVFWDGVPKGTLTNFTQFHFFNTHGRRGPSFVGEFDLRNYKFVTGTPAVPRVILDSALTVNACDAGPDLLKGTTVNMALPSCP